jgi:bifunctional DNase/RNase
MTHITVSDLQNDTFYAKIVLQTNGKSIEVDSRPSDAIALAVRTEVPIYVADEVLAKAGITLDEEGKPVLPEDRAGADKPAEVREEDLRRMSAFTDFISTLDLENLGETSGQGT